MTDTPDDPPVNDQFAHLSPDEFHFELARVTQKVHDALEGEIIDLGFLAVLNVMGAFYAMAEPGDQRANVLSILQNAITQLPEIVDKPPQHTGLYVVPKDLH